MNRKAKNRENRDEKVFSDYKKSFYVIKTQTKEIYAVLANKYNVAPETIARIVYRKRKELRESSTKEVLQE